MGEDISCVLNRIRPVGELADDIRYRRLSHADEVSHSRTECDFIEEGKSLFHRIFELVEISLRERLALAPIQPLQPFDRRFARDFFRALDIGLGKRRNTLLFVEQSPMEALSDSSKGQNLSLNRRPMTAVDCCSV